MSNGMRQGANEMPRAENGDGVGRSDVVNHSSSSVAAGDCSNGHDEDDHRPNQQTMNRKLTPYRVPFPAAVSRNESFNSSSGSVAKRKEEDQQAEFEYEEEFEDIKQSLMLMQEQIEKNSIANNKVSIMVELDRNVTRHYKLTTMKYLKW